jgi:hypothetical protein
MMWDTGVTFPRNETEMWISRRPDGAAQVTKVKGAGV